MADYLDRIRKLSALLYVIAVGMVLVTIQVPSGLSFERAPIYLLLGGALATGVGVYRFPWRRFHPNWFLVIGLASSAMISGLIYLSGGRSSIFFPTFVFVVVASGAYYGAVPLGIVTAAAALGSLSYVLYSAATREDLLRSGFEIGIYAVAAYLCHAIFRGLERSTAAAQRYASEAARAEAKQTLAQMKEEFVSHVSHELRGPLTMIVGGSELIAAGRVAPEQLPLISERVHAAATHLQGLVDELLDLAAGERTGWSLERGRHDLVALLNEAADAIATGEERARVEIRAEERHGQVSVDAQRIKQVFANLIGNALKYSPRGGSVLVLCQMEGDQIAVRVIDQGVGIGPGALERMFEKFYRAPNELARGIPGTGLGLAISKQLVEAHGGTIWAESAGVGRGSTFGVRLPLARSPVAP